MKKVIAILVYSLVAHSVFAGEAVCQKSVEAKILARINKAMPGDSAETRTIEGVKAIQKGDFLETFAVAASDEVEPSEWVVVVETKKCKIKFMDIVNDGSYTEIFDEE